MMKKRILLLTLFVLTTKLLYSQNFDFGNGIDPNISPLRSTNVTYGDIDGDTDIDVIISGRDESFTPQTRLYTNNGTGSYTEIASTPFASFEGQVMIFEDVDGDNDLDLLFAGRDASFTSVLTLYTNNGSGIFTEDTSTPFITVSSPGVGFSDINGDTFKDLVVIGNTFMATATAYTNDGNGNFSLYVENSEVPALGITPLRSGVIQFFDADADGDDDIFITGRDNSNQYTASFYRNVSASNIIYQQVTPSAGFNDFTGVDPASVAVGDINGDSRPELLVYGTSDPTTGTITTTLYNNIAGNFFPATGVPFATVSVGNVAFIDAGNDGDMDILLNGFDNIVDGITQLLENNGSGSFTSYILSDFGSIFGGDLTVFDIDGDSDEDILLSGATLNLDTFEDEPIIEYYLNLSTPLINSTTFTNTNTWDNGVPTNSTIAIIAQDYNTATMGLGDITALELIIDTGTTLTVADGNFISVENNITVNGTLDVSNTGSLVQIGEDAVTINNGTINISKTTPTLDDRNFVAMSSPVTAEARDRVYGNSRTVFSIIPSNFVPFAIDFMVFPEFEFAENFLDDNGDYLLPVTGSTATPPAGIGQLVFPQPEPNVGDGAYTLTYTQNPANPGTLNSGTITVPINYNGPATTNNYNLLGNPYASAIDVTAFINANDAVNEVYYWDHITSPTATLPGFGTSNFSMNDISIRNAMMGIAAVNGGTAPGQFMASGQGFGIKADQAEMMSGTPVVFTNSIRVIGNNDGFRNSETPTGIDKLWLNLTTTAFEEAIAQTGIGFTPNATSGIDKGYDSPRVGTFLSLFTTVDSGELLGIQSREAFDADMEITLGFSTAIEAETQYIISISDFEGIAIENNSVFIIDHLLNTIVNLKEQSYTFTAQKGLHTDRFTIVFQDREVLDVDRDSFRESGLNLYPNPSQGQITLAYAGSSTLENAVITDMNGKIIKHIDLTNFNQSQNIDLGDLAGGMYFIQITSQENTVTKKLMIR